MNTLRTAIAHCWCGRRRLFVAGGALAMMIGSGAALAEPLQWTDADGGNGHWYEVVIPGQLVTWPEAAQGAVARFGHLATPTSQAENEMVYNTFGLDDYETFWQTGSGTGPALGATWDTAEQKWEWVTGEDWNYQNFREGQDSPVPPDQPWGMSYSTLRGVNIPALLWQHVPLDGGPGNGLAHKSYVVEWSADCNGDGIVDYGQILDGTYDDANGNGVPDVCDTSNLIVNGSFESGPSIGECTFVTLGEGSTEIDGWTTTGEMNVFSCAPLGTDCNGTGCDSPDGSRHLDLKGNTPGDDGGGVRQTIPTAAGEVYRLRFWIFGHDEGCEVHIDGDFYDMDPTTVPNTWQVRTVTFVASSATTTIAIVSPEENNTTTSPMLDLVSVEVLSAAVNTPIAWDSGEGNNGHVYELVLEDAYLSWDEAQSRAVDRGGYLTSLTSSFENGFVTDQLVAPSYNVITAPANGFGPWIGGYQDTSAGDYSEPAGGWRWVSGEAWDWTNWDPGSPDEGCGGYDENVTHINSIEGDWNDLAANGLCSNSTVWSYVIEWSADCNGDGIADYGQILDGTYDDANSNGVPDCCEDGEDCDPCRSDLDGDGHVAVNDLLIVIAQWGSSEPLGDVNLDGTVDVKDLLMVIKAWGVCP